MKVLFDTKKVQKLGRISFPEQLLRNAGLKEGGPVNIYFDASSKCIILERVDKITYDSACDSNTSTDTRRQA